MRFQFIHAADLHIDSPLDALGAKDAAIKATFAAASRKAVERLIAETIDSGAKFLIVAGDVFDGDWRDVSTGLFFVRELGKLHRAGLPTFIVRGNHDAESVISRSLPYPPSVQVFDARKGHTHLIEELRVAVHGRSFSERGAPDDFLSGYAPRREGWLNVGLLHTSLDGARGHNPYAPCTTADLARFGYDYWALGHIHAAEIVARDPWVVYPGNVQGRSPRETGPKGAVRVTVEDGRIAAVEPFALDAARWAHERVDVTGLPDEEAVLGRIADALGVAQACGRRPTARHPPDFGWRDARARRAGRATRGVAGRCALTRLRAGRGLLGREAAPGDAGSRNSWLHRSRRARHRRSHRRGRGGSGIRRSRRRACGERSGETAARTQGRVPRERSGGPCGAREGFAAGSARVRLERLDLAPYGRFADRALKLSGGAALHVVLGPNESGKTTTLSAIGDLLFGFPGQTPYGFQHDQRLLRVGGVLVLADGSRLDLRRRKGNKDTLARRAGQADLRRSTCAAALGSVDRRIFETEFGLSQRALREGGEALLRAGGSLPETLAAGSASLGALNVLRDRLGVEADALFTTRALRRQAVLRGARCA